MLRILSIGLVLLSASVASAAEHEEDFNKAVAATGPEYVKLRDKLVKSAPDEFLKEKAASKDFWERVVALSVTAWKAHGEDYAKKVAGKTEVSRTGAVLYLWSRQAAKLTANDIPLAIEMLFKMSAGEIGRGSGNTVIGSMARGGKLDEYAPLILDYFNLTPIPDVTTARYVAATTANFPKKLVTLDRLVSMIETVAKDKENGPKVNEVLSRTIVPMASRMTPQEKETMIDSLVSKDKLMGTLGPQQSLRVAGMLGSPVANKAIDEYLRETPEPGKEPWAFQLLRQSRDSSGRKLLESYAADKNLPKEGRIVAIYNLSGLKYTTETGDLLKTILEDASEPDTVRTEALRAIDQLARIYRNDTEISGSLLSAIRETSLSPPEDSPLRKQVDFIKSGAEK